MGFKALRFSVAAVFKPRLFDDSRNQSDTMNCIEFQKYNALDYISIGWNGLSIGNSRQK